MIANIDLHLLICHLSTIYDEIHYISYVVKRLQKSLVTISVHPREPLILLYTHLEDTINSSPRSNPRTDAI